MKKIAVIVAVVAVALVVAGAYLWPSSVPPGQEPLTVLSPQNLSEFSAAFDANSDVPRMVLLLSPTCPGCLRGSSVAERLLASHPEKNLRVLVVWEPILATDWRKPSGSTLARITDRRARQFWDPKHLVAEELARIAKQRPDRPAPECCVDKGFHWDEAALYAPHASWGNGPIPAYWNGPVYRIAPALENALKEQP